jgi:ketol-acid reductoisomerase
MVYKQILPPVNVDVIMVAPKSPATEERKAYLDGFGFQVWLQCIRIFHVMP